MFGQSFALALILMVTAQANGDKRVPKSVDAIFMEAIRYWGSSTTDAAIVTIIDANSDAETAACVEVDDLGRAVALEHGMKWWPGHMEHITDRMRSQRDRRFVFKNDEALRALGQAQGYPELDKELCDLIWKKVYAFRGDLPPTLYVGRLHPE